jgi:hypothetical protein
MSQIFENGVSDFSRDIVLTVEGKMIYGCGLLLALIAYFAWVISALLRSKRVVVGKMTENHAEIDSRLTFIREKLRSPEWAAALEQSRSSP